MSSLLTNITFKDEGKHILSAKFEDVTIYIQVEEGSTYTPHNIYKDMSKPAVAKGCRLPAWRSLRLSNVALACIHDEDYRTIC